MLAAKIAVGVLVVWTLVYIAVGVALGASTRIVIVATGTWLLAAVIVVALTKVLRRPRTP